MILAAFLRDLDILEPQERVAIAIEREKARSIVLPADLGGGHEGKQIAIATAKKGSCYCR